jgi:hypothetical protein
MTEQPAHGQAPTAPVPWRRRHQYRAKQPLLVTLWRHTGTYRLITTLRDPALPAGMSEFWHAQDLRAFEEPGSAQMVFGISL